MAELSSSRNNNERDPLISQSGRFYFLNKQDESYQGGTTNAVRDNDGGVEAEFAPRGTTENEFAPRQVMHNMHNGSVVIGRQSAGGVASIRNANGGSVGGGFFAKLFGTTKTNAIAPKIRKAPVKIEPKVFFSNERTFLAWLHLSIILAGASIAILAFTDDMTNPIGQLYGVLLLPVAIAFIVYSMYQYGRRSRMIRNRHPGPYEDTVGPVVLGIMLMVSIVAQFALKLYSMSMTP